MTLFPPPNPAEVQTKQVRCHGRVHVGWSDEEVARLWAGMRWIRDTGQPYEAGCETVAETLNRQFHPDLVPDGNGGWKVVRSAKAIQQKFEGLLKNLWMRGRLGG